MNKVRIIYFSGTGGTKMAADCFESTFTDKGVEAAKSELREVVDLVNEEDVLVLLYPVHALNAPAPVYEWIRNLTSKNSAKAVVISVSGGGDITPNKACRIGCIKRLEKKGFEVIYEKMIVMPSNVLMKTGDELAYRLLEILPVKVEKIVDDVLAGIVCRRRTDIINRFMSMAGEAEKPGTRYFGKKIRAGEDCEGCGWCEKSCPVNNIAVQNGKPVFGNKCVLCLKCIYGCPSGALQPGLFKSFVIKDGYNLCEMEKSIKCDNRSQATVEQLARGYLWKGVKTYLLNDD